MSMCIFWILYLYLHVYNLWILCLYFENNSFNVPASDIEYFASFMEVNSKLLNNKHSSIYFEDNLWNLEFEEIFLFGEFIFIFRVLMKTI